MGVREWFRQTAEAPQQTVYQNNSEAKQNQIEKLPTNVKAQAVEAARPSARIMDGVAKAHEQVSAHSGQTDGREALIRNQGGQGREQSAMSPTDHGNSHAPSQARMQSRGRGMER